VSPDFRRRVLAAIGTSPELEDLAAKLRTQHRAEVEKLDLAWWCAIFTLRERFIGGVFVWAFGPVDAANEIRMRDLVDRGMNYTVTFARVGGEIPRGWAFRLLSMEELELCAAEAERT
jgi:hypothetical protein